MALPGRPGVTRASQVGDLVGINARRDVRGMIASQAGGNAQATLEGHRGVCSATLEPDAGRAGQQLGVFYRKGYGQIGGDLIRRNRLLALLGPTCGANQYARAHEEHLSATRNTHLSSPFYSTMSVMLDVCDSEPEDMVTVIE